MSESNTSSTTSTTCPMNGCDNTRDTNSRTNRPFPTCPKCVHKCPNFNSCGNKRGKNQKNVFFKTCAKCRPDFDPTKVKAKIFKTKSDTDAVDVIDDDK